jgi:Escherichia/Staphylococcus phage prohead protease
VPWHIEKGGGTCGPTQYAVIKDADGSTAGCHPSEAAAKKQLAALYVQERSMVDDQRAADQGNITTPDSGDLNTAARKYAASRGWAMADGSYPIRPADMHGRADLQKAIRAVGRGGGSHDAIRRHIIKRARALGLADMIPDNWSSGGVSRSAEAPATGISVIDKFDRPGPSEELQYRSFAPQLEVRAAGGGRTVFGIAVPYNAPTRIDERLVEQFARGAFDHQIPYPRSVKFAREHMALGGELIGAATMLRDDPAGLYVEMRVANTPKGDETLELVKDGALDQLSIAFRERQNRRLGGGVVERLKANLREVAVVLEGAYGELATAMGVRSRQPYDDPTVDPETEALNEAVEQFRHGLPPLPDYDVEIRAADLGMNWR